MVFELVINLLNLTFANFDFVIVIIIFVLNKCYKFHLFLTKIAHDPLFILCYGLKIPRYFLFL
jgi:hypothetical protein